MWAGSTHRQGGCAAAAGWRSALAATARPSTRPSTPERRWRERTLATPRQRDRPASRVEAQATGGSALFCLDAAGLASEGRGSCRAAGFAFGSRSERVMATSLVTASASSGTAICARTQPVRLQCATFIFSDLALAVPHCAIREERSSAPIIRPKCDHVAHFLTMIWRRLLQRPKVCLRWPLPFPIGRRREMLRHQCRVAQPASRLRRGPLGRLAFCSFVRRRCER